MTSFFGIDFAKTAACQVALTDATNKMRAEVSALEAQAQSSLAQWDGEARSQYTVLKARWDANMDAMAKLASGHAEGLQQTGSTLARTEAGVTDMWQPGGGR